MSSFDLHFVIVTYNGEKWIEKCLESILNLGGDFEVHIIDNGSTDRTIELCERLGFSVWKSEKNLGFGAANNLGIKNAIKKGASHLFLLNQDAYMDKKAIDNFLSLDLAKDTDTIFSFVQKNGDGSDFDIMWKNGYLAENNCPGFVEDSKRNQIKPIYDMKFSNAAAWMMPVQVIKSIGGFSTTFFHYGEDTNYIHRAHYHKISVKMLPNSIVRHDRSEQIRAISPHLTTRKKKSRKFLVDLSNPSETVQPIAVLLRTMRIFLQKLVRLQSPNAIIEYHFLKLVYAVGIIKILRNRRRSRMANGPFMETNP